MSKKILVPKSFLPLYLMMAPLSCLIFILYTNYTLWMFFACLIAYWIQLAIGGFLIDNITHTISVSNNEELKMLDIRYKSIRLLAYFLVILTIILDTFPFWATSNWFCYDIGLDIPKYEGGSLVSLMTVITILSWVVMMIMASIKVKSPSSQYYNNIRVEDNIREKKKQVEATARIIHECNISKYGDNYYEICPQFVFNESDKKIWLCQTEYSFEEIIDAEIEDIVTQQTTGGNTITKTKLGSMVGRAIVGGVLTGGIGAIIGGATAKRESTVLPTSIHTKHQYNLLVTTNNISNPLITIHLNGDGELAQHCLSTLKAIIHKSLT